MDRLRVVFRHYPGNVTVALQAPHVIDDRGT
jgi:hypothetical protein